MQDNLKSNDRILVLEKIEGKEVKSSTGLIDPRLFTGKNKVHVSFDEQNQLWGFSYEAGGVPEDLKQRFTTFPKALDFARHYFNKRNINIKEVID